MSENIAVVPVSSPPSGSDARTSRTRRSVRSSVGPKAGSASKTLIAPSGLTTGGVTATMSSRASRSWAIRWTSPSETSERSRTTVRGPLAPLPYSSDTRSNARRVVVSVDWLLASCGQVRMPRAGSAIAIISSAAPIAHGSGRLATRCAQRAVSGAFVDSRPLRTLRGSSRRPANRLNTGTRVSAAAATVTTAIAVAKPNEEYVESPARRRPSSETSTVAEAKTTERPAVAAARPAASGTSYPWRRYSTCRVSSSSA